VINNSTAGKLLFCKWIYKLMGISANAANGAQGEAPVGDCEAQKR
jgi:hypothetical protein